MKNPKTQEVDLQGNDYELTETHVAIYEGFTSFVKWSTISVIAILILMAIFLL
ncbi:aa3-type cytochrome c oxidase subunit IV [Thalassospira sp. MCCC 1A02491]|uniref:aa3-type cytochrome c oxidase subunit IV n=1 Tax=Thalassospira sp. MCCC 1A02491 TaxID=1769751 RepID=UPI000ABE07C4|nr:aa3-type cytochrome c oxidase subunit IV [Thalassospira sp. MCCC 1A02491]